MALKASDPALLLAGEIKGLGIPGFDLDNSPYRVAQAKLEGRRLVQKTTNGVKATLAALDRVPVRALQILAVTACRPQNPSSSG